MADVFEARAELDQWRERLWVLIDSTPALDWLLLTKRPERIEAKAPWANHWPANVWLGTTAENQLWANRRIPILLQHPAAVRFVSCEPLIGPLDLSSWLGDGVQRGIDWVIAGGESGFKARPMNPEWPRKLRDQCSQAGVAFHFKQWGHWCPDEPGMPNAVRRQYVMTSDGSRIALVRLGKHAAGRDLDGQEWNEFPVPDLSTVQSLQVRAAQ